MNESIYNLIPEPYVEPERSERHTSKFKVNSVKLPPPSYTTFPTQGEAIDGSAAMSFKRPAANMGRPVAPEIDPRSFLKKGEGPKFAVDAVPKQKLVLKAPIVMAQDKPVMGLKSEKDFVKANAIEIAAMAPKGIKPQPELATSRKSFGKVPQYLTQVKGHLEAEQQYMQSLRENEERRQKEAKEQFVRQMSEEQKQTLLAQLKERLDEKRRQFLSMPFARDTMMQIARKEAVEKELKEIEQAIAKLDKKVVYIYQDDPMYGQWAKSQAVADAQMASVKLMNASK